MATIRAGGQQAIEMAQAFGLIASEFRRKHDSRQCARGRTYASALLAFMQTHEQQPMLGHVVRRIGERGEWGGTEIGFMAGIAEAAAR